MRIGVVFLKNVLTLLASHALIPLQLMAAVSATVTTIQKNFFWSQMTTLIISNEWMKDIKILKSLEGIRFIDKRCLWKYWKWSKWTKRWVSWYIFRHIKCSLLASLLEGKGFIWAGKGTIERWWWMKNWFCSMVDQRKVIGLISSWDHCQIPTVTNLWHAVSRTWTCVEPEFRLCWIKLCSIFNTTSSFS